MAKLSKEMGQAAKVYDKRARQNAVAEKSAARTEREQLVAAAVVPALAMQVGNSMHAPGKTWDTSDTDDSMVKVSEVLKHKEGQKLVADIQRKHQAAKGPFGSLKSLQADDKQDEANEATSMTHWNALVNGWRPPRCTMQTTGRLKRRAFASNRCRILLKKMMLRPKSNSPRHRLKRLS